MYVKIEIFIMYRRHFLLGKDMAAYKVVLSIFVTFQRIFCILSQFFVIGLFVLKPIPNLKVK
jgi:hypothetical protein